MKRVVSAGQVDSIKMGATKNSERKKSELETIIITGEPHFLQRILFRARTFWVRTFLMVTIKCLVESKKQLGESLWKGRQKLCGLIML